jgi:PAS domain S-box-containing protein
MTPDNPQAFRSSANAARRAALLESQRRVLERMATGVPLEEILLTLVNLIQEQAVGMRCAVLLSDSGQTRLRFVAAPDIPQDYQINIERYLLIAPKMGSCGTAAYLKRPVYARDIATNALWENFGQIGVRNGLRAIWSTPILSHDSRVLGTFAMYYGEPRLPNKDHIQLIDMAVQMARVAIEATVEDDLVRLTFDNAPRPIVITDMEGRIARANHAFARQLGYAQADLRGKAISEITDQVHSAALLKEPLAKEMEVFSHKRYRTRDGRVLWGRGRSSLRRDPTGKPRYVVTHIERLSEAAKDPLGGLSAREREVLAVVVAGRTSKEIAAELGISPATVDTYRSRIMQKLGVEDLPGLVRFAIRHGIASL